MQKLKKTLAFIATVVFSIAFIVPAQAQFYGGPYGAPGSPGGPGSSGGPGSPGGFSPMGDPMEMGSYGMTMPFMSPFMGFQRRQQDQVTPITQLPAPAGYGKDLLSTLESAPELSLFTAALKAAGYGEKLKGPGNYIVFAPSDKTIMRDLAVKDAASLVGDVDLIKGLAENCIVYQPPGQRQNNEKAFVALNGKEVRMLKARTGVTANGADVLNYVQAGNGLVVVTDGAVGT